MFIPLKLILIGFDPSPIENIQINTRFYACGLELQPVCLEFLKETQTIVLSGVSWRWKFWRLRIIELDDGNIYRKALYLMVKAHRFPVC